MDTPQLPASTTLDEVYSEIAKLPPDRQQRFTDSIDEFRSEIHRMLHFQKIDEECGGTDMEIQGYLKEEQGKVAAACGLLIGRVLREQQEGPLLLRMYIHPGDRPSQQRVSTDGVLDAQVLDIIQGSESVYGGVKFVVYKDSDATMAVIVFDQIIFHANIAAQFVKEKMDFIGAGKITGSYVCFDSDTCIKDYGFDGPKDPILEKEILQTIEEQWNVLHKTWRAG